MKKNIEYLECDKGGYHEGQLLNIICLEVACRSNMLCCCACIQQHHQGHKTKTLKRILVDAENTAIKCEQSQKKESVKSHTKCNTDIMSSMLQNQQKNSMIKIGQIKKQFLHQLQTLQQGIISYYNNLNHEIHNQTDGKKYKNIKATLQGQIECIQGSSSEHSLKKNLQELLDTVAYAQNHSVNANLFEKPDEQSYLNYIQNSNNDIRQIIENKLPTLYTNLQNNNKKLQNSLSKIPSFWNNQLYKFSNMMHHKNINVVTPFKIKATIDSVYQVATMTPALSFSDQIQTFRFKINNCDMQWVGVGVCYEDVIKQYNYEFKFDVVGHGCYMISANGGSWSHSDAFFNNCVKSFFFKQGDSVTCVVKRDRIIFIKDIPTQYQFSEEYAQREYYELAIKEAPGKKLYPCVVCYYNNTEVEYISSFSSQLRAEDLPVHRYKFSDKYKHQDIVLDNPVHARSVATTQYKCCILDNAIEDNGPIDEIKSVTFRISRSTGAWIGLGVCHRKLVSNKNFGFNFEKPGHGCYMMSANGGSWSHTDASYNNIVKTFKLLEGDLITCELDQINSKIIFKRSIDRYELPYVPIKGDKLHPLVVFYYPDDEVEILPSFK